MAVDAIEIRRQDELHMHIHMSTSLSLTCSVAVYCDLFSLVHRLKKLRTTGVKSNDLFRHFLLDWSRAELAS